MVMATSQDELPTGMWFYSFMFGEHKPFVSQYIEQGRLPAPSSLALGVGAGMVVTVARLALDWGIYKVKLIVRQRVRVAWHVPVQFGRSGSCWCRVKSIHHSSDAGC